MALIMTTWNNATNTTHLQKWLFFRASTSSSGSGLGLRCKSSRTPFFGAANRRGLA
jgi:hypothetical protein